MPSPDLSDSNTHARKTLRQHMRKQRAQLSPLQQRLAALRLAHHLAHHPRLRKAEHIGLYVGHQGELDPWRFTPLWQHNKSLYLPVLHPDHSQRLLFVRADKRWCRNRFGIKEPLLRSQDMRPLWRLDILLIPLLAFDRQGGRLGMGGGYYDRTLASLPTWAKRPWCIGIGYRFQECGQLPLAGWDQPLDDIVTD